MFMDLLVLADSEGAVDMTYEAIARRTNVPIDEVKKYIAQLCEPDPASRSKKNDGRRLIALDASRDWGWLIVNYSHYREIRDEEARRAYFRDAQRRSRARRGKTTRLPSMVDCLKSVSSCSLTESVKSKFAEWVAFRTSQGKAPKNWVAMFEEQIKWLGGFDESLQLEILSQSMRNCWRGLFEPSGRNGQKKAASEMSAFELRSRIDAIDDELGQTNFKKDRPEIADRRKKLFARKRELKTALTSVA